MSISRPQTRSEFRELCLRNNGKGAIKINVTDQQAEDAIEEALTMFKDFHMDGTFETLLKYQVTSDDITNGYITLPDQIISVRELIDTASAVYPPTGWMSLEYQFMWNVNMMGADISVAPYYSARTDLELINQVLRGRPLIRFSKHTNRLYIETNWDKYTVGQWILLYAHTEIDPETYPDVWRDRWMIRYATAQIKRRWGNNLTKFIGMKIPGQTEFNGAAIKSEAEDEIKELEAELSLKYKAPAVFFTG